MLVIVAVADVVKDGREMSDDRWAEWWWFDKTDRIEDWPDGLCMT